MQRGLAHRMTRHVRDGRSSGNGQLFPVFEGRKLSDGTTAESAFRVGVPQEFRHVSPVQVPHEPRWREEALRLRNPVGELGAAHASGILAVDKRWDTEGLPQALCGSGLVGVGVRNRRCVYIPGLCPMESIAQTRDL